MTKLEKLQKAFRELMKKLTVIRDIRPEDLTDENRKERNRHLVEIDILVKDIEAEKKTMRIDARNNPSDDDDGPDFDDLSDNPLYSMGNSRDGSRSSEGDLIFQAADGREHRAIPVSKRFASSESQKGLEEIGPGSLGKILRAKLLGDPLGLNDSERRAMGEGVGAAGGWFVPSLVSSYVIDLARNQTCVLEAGGWTLPMDSPELTLVKVLTDPTAYWRAEHVAITESDGVFVPIRLKAVVLGCLIRVSQALLEDAPSAGETIEKMMAAALGLELDRVALLGSGSTEPRGLFNCDDINEYSMGANGAAPTNYDPFSYACQYVLEDNGIPTAAIMAPRTFGTLDRLKAATTNQPLVAPQSYLDLKKFYTNQIPNTQTQGTSSAASCAFVGDFTNIVIGMRKQLTIDISPAAGTDTFAKVEALIRAYMRVDVAVLRENHFTVIKGIIE